LVNSGSQSDHSGKSCIFIHNASAKLKLIDDDKRVGLQQQFLTDMFDKLSVKSSTASHMSQSFQSTSRRSYK